MGGELHHNSSQREMKSEADGQGLCLSALGGQEKHGAVNTGYLYEQHHHHLEHNTIHQHSDNHISTHSSSSGGGRAYALLSSNANRVAPCIDETKPRHSPTSNSSNKRYKEVNSVVGFSCCRPNQRVKHEAKSDISLNQNQFGLSRLQGRAFHISGSSAIPDVITSHSVKTTTTIAKDIPTSQGNTNQGYLDDAKLPREYYSSADACVVESESSSHHGSYHCCVQLEHVQQQHSWDCGIACVMMVLSDSQREHLNKNLYKICDQEGFQKSTWSIDLAYLLHRFEIPFRYYTITLGVDPGLNSEKFYQSAIYKDAIRVVERFRYASSHGVSVCKSSVPLDVILSHLRRGLPIIALTNAQLLHCRLCTFSTTRTNLRACFAAASCNTPYQGHFVVLVGYDEADNTIYYANPSTKEKVCCCSYDQMEDARLCYGTDEDIIFVDSDVGCTGRGDGNQQRS